MKDDDYIEAEIVEEGDYTGPTSATTSAYYVETTPEGRPPRSWDFFLTIFLIFLLLVLTVIFVILGFGFGLSTIGCADSGGCNYNLISFGSLMVIVGVPAIALIGIVFSVVWIARRKFSFWIPLVASLATVGVFTLGSYLVELAVPVG